ncbi:MAG: 3-deoxy-manno-octulosonate cytidylyltransferase [Elusimicrobiota bacterium]
MNSCLTIIPARLASTRFPRKVLADLDGKPMIEWCWRAAVRARLGPVLVAVDSLEVAKTVRSFGGLAIMTPPSCPSGSDRVWWAAKNRTESVILNFQADMPLIKPATLRAAVSALDSHCDIATAVIKITDPSRLQDRNVVKAVLTKDRRCLYFSRSDVSSWEHLGLYAYRRDSLKRFVRLSPSPLERLEKLEQLRALEAGMSIRAAIVREVPVAVDTPPDLRRAQTILRQGHS